MNNSIKPFLLRGIASGAAGGAAAALFIRFVTETQIGYALRFEDATGIGTAPGDEPMYSRATQHWGGMAAALIFGVALGVLFGVAIAALRHRIAATNEFGRAARVATAGFVAIVLLPALKYPPNPPTVGDPDSIGDRTTQYLLFLTASVLVVFGAWMVWQRLTARGWDGARRFAVGGGGFVLAVVILFVAWPASPDRIGPPDSDAAPVLRIADDAPTDVLDAMLATARATGDESIRDPADPTSPLDLSTVTSGADLVGAPVAVSTTKLVPNAYDTVIWHFRTQSIAGLAILWAVMATVFGFLADAKAPAAARAEVPALDTGGLAGA